MSRKICLGIIGGGSVFTPELIKCLAKNSATIGEMVIRLMDINPERLDIVGGLSRRIVHRMGRDDAIRIDFVETYEETIQGADFVLIQLRQGGVDARIEDEKLGLKYRLPFTETISVCGVATFLRTYPVIERLAELVQRLAPDAWVMNFTNPSGQITETLSRLGCRKVVGVCNGAIGLQDFLAQKLGVRPDDVLMNWRGLNHLTFTDAVYVNGQNRLTDVIDNLEDYEHHSLPFPRDLIRALGFLPNGYLQYYYLRDQLVKKLQAQEKTRSMVVKDVEKTLLDTFSRVDDIPEALTLRGGYGYSRIVANLIKGVVTDDHSLHYVVVKNGTILKDLPEDAFVEAPALVKAEAIRPLQGDPLPEITRGLVVTMKRYERMAIDAAQRHDRTLLLHALMIHPLIFSYNIAAPLLEDVLATNADFLPDWNESVVL